MDVLWKATPEVFLSSPYAPAFPCASTPTWAPYDVDIHTQMHTKTSMKVSLLSSEGRRGPKRSALMWGSRPCPSSSYSWTFLSTAPFVPLGCSRREVGRTLLGFPRSLTLYSFMLSWLLSWALRESRDGGKGNTQRALSICVKTEGSNATHKNFLFCWCYQILV